MSDDLETVSRMIADEIGGSKMKLDEFTALDDIPGWDSVAFAGVVIAIEAEFGIAVTRHQIDSIATVGDFVAVLREQARSR